MKKFLILTTLLCSLIILNGCKEAANDKAKVELKDENSTKWVFNLDMPSYIPFMKFVENDELKK